MDPFNIVVVGETCLDVIDYGYASRRNPEAPSLVFTPEYQSITPGMAGNVGNCLKLLDPSAKISVYANWSKISKRRYVDKTSGYILFRVDEGDILPQDDKADLWAFERFLEGNGMRFGDVNAVLIADYAKGFLSTEFIRGLSEKAKTYNFPIFMDTKKVLGEWSRKIFVTKINNLEYGNLRRENSDPASDTENLIVTLGDAGAMRVTRDAEFVFAAKKTEVVNLCGAGDVFNAALALSYLKGYALDESIVFANKAASIKVTRQGTAVVKGSEVWD